MTTHPWVGVRPWQQHGRVLMVAGIVFVLIGLSYLVVDPPASRTLALQIVLLWTPMEFWGAIFILAGGLSILSSRWPPVSKTWGYMVLSGLSAVWSLVYLAGITVPMVLERLQWVWFLEGSSLSQAPVSGLSGVASWGLISFMWVAISGLVNADDILNAPIVVEDAGEIIDPKELI